MVEKIQSLIYVDERTIFDIHRLYYRSERRVSREDEAGRFLFLPAFSYTDFATYFNEFSYRKWKKFTAISNVKVKIRLQGECTISLVGYNKERPMMEKEVFLKKEVNNSAAEYVELEFPENSQSIIGFEIETYSDVKLYDGYYTGEFESTRDIDLAICTTTCHKEEYITRNVKKLKEEILDSKDLVGEHLFIHVVDNGRSLSEDDFPKHEKIYLHPNLNTGGAGGFARGMIESMHQEEPITHVLLMDDDVIIEPESIKRTYVLLRHLLKAYQKRFISGAMLQMENTSQQQEDVGYVSKESYFLTWKPQCDHRIMENNLDNEKDLPFFENSYAAWWYCCIPMDTIKKEGLPLPVFVRGDDVEYGLRCNPGFITMNSICVWHLGFNCKFNVGMDHYQVNRNLLIDKATTGVLQNVDVIGKIKQDFKHHFIRLDYDSAEIVIKAIEDYMKGPEFIKQNLGEKILKENNALGHKFEPLTKFNDADWGQRNPFEEREISDWKMNIFDHTWNGHVNWPFACKNNTITVPFNDIYLPGKCLFAGRILAVNVFDRTAFELKRDNARGKQILKRYKKALKNYEINGDRVAKEYAAAKSYLTSEEFWRKYLEI